MDNKNKNFQKQKQKELWNSIENIPELQQIVKIKASIQANIEQRSNTKHTIKELKTDYDKMKKHIVQFLKEQNNNNTKLSAKKAMQSKKQEVK